MKIEVLDYVLESEFMSAATSLNDPESPSVFNIWLKFEDSKDLSVVSFGVQVPAREYTPEQFQEAVAREAEDSIRRMLKKQAEDHNKQMIMEEKQKKAGEIGPRIAKSLGIEWYAGED